MTKKKNIQKLALATASVALVSTIPFQAIAAEQEDVKTLSLNTNTADLRMAVGEETTLTAVADFLKENSETEDYTIQWSVNTEGKDILSVNSRGKVTAKAAGTAEVTALIKGKTNLQATVIVDVYSTVNKLEVQNKVINLSVGEVLPIQYQVLPAKAVDTTVKFRSNDTKTATVDSKGNVKGITEGETTIIVTTNDAGNDPFDNPITEEVTVKVTSTVTGVEITNVPNKVLNLKQEEKFQLKWNVSPSNAFLKDVTFKSSNTKAATVNSKGEITGSKTGGDTVIQVITKDGSYNDSINVSVDQEIKDDLTAISIEDVRYKDKEKFIDLYVGEKTTLKVLPTPENFNLSRTKLGYEVENPEILRVASNGSITALKAGSTKVKVFYKDNEEVFDEVTVVNTSTVTGISGEDSWSLRVGEIAMPPVNVLPVATAKNKELIITTDSKGIIKVTSNKQEIEGLKAGVVKAVFVTVDGEYEHPMTINVVSTVTSFEIPFETVKLGLEPYQFEPVFNKDAYLKTVKYEVLGDKIVTINNKTNTITPKAEGKTTVRATTIDGELVDEFEVIVDYDATKIDIYDENKNLIGSSDPVPTKPGNNNGSNNSGNKEIRKMILEKLLERADSEILREVIKRLLVKI